MKTSSAKQKGRLAQQQVAKMVKEAYGFPEGNVFWRSMGVSGTDLYFSDYASSRCPFDFEVKCQESLNIWSALEQAKENSKPPRIPLVVFKRNRSEIYACLLLEDLLKLAVKESDASHN